MSRPDLNKLDAHQAAALWRSLDYCDWGEWRAPDGEIYDQEDMHTINSTLAHAWLDEHPVPPESNPAPSESASKEYFRSGRHPQT